MFGSSACGPGAVWSEGPVWFAAGRYLIWSDIPNNRMLRWVEESGQVSVFRQALQQFQRQHGRQPGTARHLRAPDAPRDPHRVRRLDHRPRRPWRGQAAQFAERRRGQIRRFRSGSPTRPTASTATTRATAPTPEIDGCHVYRVDPPTARVERVIDDMARPNGLAFSPDEKLLYVADTGATHKRERAAPHPPLRRRADGKSVNGGEIFAEFDTGLFDGFRVDRRGGSGRAPATASTATNPTGR